MQPSRIPTRMDSLRRDRVVMDRQQFLAVRHGHECARRQSPEPHLVQSAHPWHIKVLHQVPAEIPLKIRQVGVAPGRPARRPLPAAVSGPGAPRYRAAAGSKAGRAGALRHHSCRPHTTAVGAANLRLSQQRGSIVERHTPPNPTITMEAADILAVAIPPVAQAVAGPIAGAVLGVVTAAGDRGVEALGQAQREPEPAPMQRGTWFDLASLTKVIFTAPTILQSCRTTARRAGRSADRGDSGPAAIRPGGAGARPDVSPMPQSPDPFAGGRAAVHLRAGSGLRCAPSSCSGSGRGAASLFRHQLHAAGHRDRASDRPMLGARRCRPALTFHPDPAA